MGTSRWMIRGPEFGNCNCNYGCPCQFNWPTPTHGYCEALACGHIDEGFFDETRLDGLDWALLLRWPGPIHEGRGEEQAVIDERADPAQREALRAILHGEQTEPGATHFHVFNSTMATVHDPLFAPIELAIDIGARSARVRVPGLIESRGEPIRNPATGEEHRVRIELPNGFEYMVAEVGSATTRSHGAIALELSGSYGQFCTLHMTEKGVVR